MTRALLVIDMQRGFDDLSFWGPTANPECEAHVAALIDAWRRDDEPIVVVRHESASVGSPLHPDAEGNGLVDAVAAAPAALVVSKSVNSAFYGDPDLNAWLHERGIRELVICGIQTNMCVYKCKVSACASRGLASLPRTILSRSRCSPRHSPTRTRSRQIPRSVSMLSRSRRTRLTRS